ncbi:MAG: thioredoxin [Nanoarchaeota archaeon]
MVEEISNIKEFDNALKAEYAFVDFYAEWCMPCVMMGPIIDEVAIKKFQKKVHFTKVNVDEYGEIAEKYGVMSIPTMIILKAGKEVGRIIGAVSEETLIEKITSYIK